MQSGFTNHIHVPLLLSFLFLGGTRGFGRGTERALKKMLIFPNCSEKKCPIQKILNSTGKMPGGTGTTCHAEVSPPPK